MSENMDITKLKVFMELNKVPQKTQQKVLSRFKHNKKTGLRKFSQIEKDFLKLFYNSKNETYEQRIARRIAWEDMLKKIQELEENHRG
jgi:hypothetical protein